MDQAVKRMRGEPNTKVVLTIFRKTENRSFPVTITREEIRVQSVRAKVVEPGYGWIRVSQFQDRTVEDFTRKIDEMYKQDPSLKGLVLDLRNDPGGLLEASVAISAAFLPQDAVVVTTNGQIAESKAVFKASPEFYLRRGGTDPLRKLPEALKNIPLVVLVNEGSASASEIVAGALQDHKRAIVMGAQTFGKGSVQTVMTIEGCGPKPCGLKLTVSRYYTPNGRSIQTQGITPNVIVEATPPPPDAAEAEVLRERNYERHLRNEQGERPVEHKRLADYQLQVALDYLKSWAVFSRQSARKG
jgi:carboxyl-terminal processing protease